MSIFFRLILFFFCTTAFAADPPLQLYDEGVKQGVIFNVDCVGAGISCAKSNVTGTLTVSGGGSGSAAGGLNAVQYNSPVGTFAGDETKFSFDGTNIGIGTTNGNALLSINSTASQYLFRVDDNGLGDTSPFIISSEGNVGIGTISAPDRINIKGIRFNAYAGNPSTGPVQLANQGYDLLIGNSISSGAYFRLLPYLGDIYFENFTPGSVTASGNLIFRHTMNSGDSAQEDMRIDVNGNMGIGLTSPRALLNVGTTTAKDIFRIDDNGAGDTTPFIIDSAGNVGIGTTTSSYPLDVRSSDTYFTRFTGTNSAARVIINSVTGSPNSGFVLQENGTNKWSLASYSNGRFTFYNDGAASEAMGILNTNNAYFTANLGIGDASPAAKLSVGLNDLFQVNSSGLMFTQNGSASTPSHSFTNDTNTGMFGNGSDEIGFATGGTERIRINSNGNVGIGTTRPSYGLDISDGQYALVIGADNAAKTRTDATQKISRFGGAHYTNAEEPVAFFSSNSGNGFNNISFGGGTSLMNAATNLYFYTASNGTTTTGTTRMLIDGTGNIGIGTTVLDSGVLQLPQNGTSQGHAACWGTNNCAGYCTDVVGVTGTCTCTCL